MRGGCQKHTKHACFALWTTPPRRFLFHCPLFLTCLHVPTAGFLLPSDRRLLPACAPTRVQVITAHPRHSRFLSCRSHLPEELETAMMEALASTRSDPISWRSRRRRWRKHWRVHGRGTTTTAAVAFLTMTATPTFEGTPILSPSHLHLAQPLMAARLSSQKRCQQQRRPQI
jgi:hypothetical protein